MIEENKVVKKGNRLFNRLKSKTQGLLRIIFQNKRLLLLAIIVIAVPVTVGLALVQQEFRSKASRTYTNDDYISIRAAWLNYKTGGNYDTSDPELNAEIEKEVDNIRKDGRNIKSKLVYKPNYLFEDLKGPKGGKNVAESYKRVEKMALAYATKGAIDKPSERAEFLREIKKSLNWLNNHWYNTKTCPGNNFDSQDTLDSECSGSLEYQTTIPEFLTSSMILIYDGLDKDPKSSNSDWGFIRSNMDAVERFYTDPRHNNSNRFYDSDGVHDTAANLAMQTVPLLLRAGISKDEDALDEALYNYEREFMTYNTSTNWDSGRKNDGIYRDGSFIQHKIFPYNMWYGAMFFNSLAKLTIVLLQTDFYNEDSKNDYKNKLYKYFKDSYQPFIFNNSRMDMVLGENYTQHSADEILKGEIGLLSLLSDEKYKNIGLDVWRKMNGGLDRSSIPRIIQTYNLNKNPDLDKSDIYEITKMFPRMDRFVHVKKDYAFAISLSSKRIGTFESIGKLNKRGWYMSDGMFYFYNKLDPTQYEGGYWRTINMTKLPGTTVDDTIKLNPNNTYDGKNFDSEFKDYQSPKTNAGGAVLDDNHADNKYAVVGMDLKSARNVRAKKSYFIFDDEVVALGSDISAPRGKTVTTIVENRKIKEDNSNQFLSSKDTINSISSPRTLNNPDWIYLEKTGGYYFPSGGSIFVQKQKRNGTWNQVNGGETENPYPFNFAEIIYQHGNSPTNGNYAYVFLPNKSKEGTISYAGKPDIKVIENSPTAQVVKHEKLNNIITSANFWGRGSAGGITAWYPGSIIIDEEPDRIIISVADPTQTQNKLVFELNQDTGNIIPDSTDPKITVLSTSPLKFSVDTKGAKGDSFKVSLAKKSDSKPSPEPEPSISPEPDSPSGVLEVAECAALKGWACDESEPTKTLNVKFYKDGPLGIGELIGGIPANLSREEAIGAECGGNNNHGFSFENLSSIKDGLPHQIYAYVVDDSNPLEPNDLADVPKSLTCFSGGPTTPTVSPSIEPSPVSCVRNLPKVTYDNLNKSGKRLEKVTYKITITNRDSSACPERKIALDLSKPASLKRWTYNPKYIKIAPGQTKEVNFWVKSGRHAVIKSTAILKLSIKSFKPNQKINSTQLKYTVLRK